MFDVDVDGDDNDGDDGGDGDNGDGHVELVLRTHPRLQVRGHRLEISSEIG